MLELKKSSMIELELEIILKKIWHSFRFVGQELVRVRLTSHGSRYN